MNALIVFGFPMATTPLDWAAERIRAARELGPLPLYGSDQWAALAARDPRRWGAVIRAAEAWRDYCSPERIKLDLQAEENEFVRRTKAASVDVSLATDWAALASEPTYAELVRRRSA